jgi:hypothetical protein
VAGKRDRAARLADLERLIRPRKPGTRTLDDVCAEHGLSEAEMQRLAHWLHECLSREEQGWPSGRAAGVRGGVGELPPHPRPGALQGELSRDRQDLVERAPAQDVRERPPAEKVPPYVGVGHDIWEAN